MISGKTVVLGVTGSIAAYKAVEIACELVKAGARVDVIMTKPAVQFVSPLTFRSVTGNQIVTEMFAPVSEVNVEHVALAKAADVVVVAPATANIIARIAAGMADDMLTCTVLATKAPVIIAPAMNVNMYENKITQENLAKLKAHGFTIVGPGCGWLACGDIGQGRLCDIPEIIGAIKQVMGKNGDLAGKKVVVTAGGTQEPLDPVRHVSNRSSGKMGYALAEAARDRGASVTLITAPTALPAPYGVDVIDVRTAEDMLEKVQSSLKGADVLVMAAAVADYRPLKVSASKIKKTGETVMLELARTRDILASVEGDFVRVGFAAESENLVANAREKLRQKRLDLIVANDITAADSTFGSDTDRVTIIDRNGKAEELPLLAKREVADKILDRVVALYATDRT